MKLIFKLIKIIITLLVIGGLFYLFINKTFIYNVYKNDVIKSGIPIKRFMYVKDDIKNNKANFYTFWPSNSLEEEKDSYLKKLELCYSKYYYDKDNDVTITEYKINDKNYYREVIINYVNDNYCSDEYKLSDMWVYEYNSLSAYIDGDISEKAMTNLIDKVYNSKNIEPVITNYKNKYSLKVNCDKNGDKYSLTFEDFNDNQLLVKKEVNENIKFAVYEIEDVKMYLEGLDEIK